VIRAVAVVKDLLFVARIRETARLVGTPLTFARSAGELRGALAESPDLIILDLTTSDWKYEDFFSVLEGGAPPPAVLGFTTHALARVTQPLHARCTRVVTRETLTQELPELLRTGLAA